MPEILEVETDDLIQACFPPLQLLRPHLQPDDFVARIRRQQDQGYRLLAVRDGETIQAVAGWRMLEYLAWGKVLYVDDLVTLPGARKHGYGGLLLDRLIAYAREQRCDAVHLDTGYQRYDAHRLYLNKGFVFASHHCALTFTS